MAERRATCDITRVRVYHRLRLANNTTSLLLPSAETAIMRIRMLQAAYIHMQEKEEMWLEMRACQETASATARELEHETVLRIPALSEALKAVEKASLDMAKKGGGNNNSSSSSMWDYSRKLDSSEIGDILSLFAGAQKKDDGRSTSRSADYSYYGRCYTLTLFAFKQR